MRSSQSEKPATSDQPERLLSATLPVRLGRERLWDELVRKAENPVPFIPAIIGCTVLERHPDGFLREIVIEGGHRQRERVVLVPPHRVEFEQVTDPLLVRITNEITGDDDALSLTLTVELSPEGLAGGPQLVAGTREYFAGTLRSIVDTLHGTDR
ncbi:hypothetical protein GCM10027063_26620 [Promicromonospora xylanilytica]